MEDLDVLKRALIELKDLRAQLKTLRQASTEPIAVVGASCRFPGGANDLESFWRLLREGIDAVVEVPADRWDVDRFYDPDPEAPGKMITRWGGFLQGMDIRDFDADFFGISPREAASMDPQQRLLLEVAWEALERAGLPEASLIQSKTGVFLGFMATDYFGLTAGTPAAIDAYSGSGADISIAAGRLSYLLGLQGPCVSVSTACSSSLVSLHLACQSLRARESDVALAGGVNVMLSPESTIYTSKVRAMAADGRCKTFDAAADGYVRGEGCGIVVLRRLSDALAAGDRVLALIRGSAVNHDGRSSGLTAPNGPAQQAVIRSALAAGGVAPQEVSYVEAHGTGTPLGDPIEVQALAAVLGQGRDAERPLLIGSVKTNVGHLEAAAGVAGLLKLVLALQHETLPAHLHLREPNRLVPWDQLPVRVAAAPTPWPRGERPRRAGLSSFGFSGTNAHVVVEEAPVEREAAPAEGPDAPRVLPISARSPEALRAMAERLAGWLERERGRWSDVVYTAWLRRTHHAHREAVVARSMREAAERLRALAREQGTDAPAARPRVAFIFSGQGSQWLGMGRELYAAEPAFRDTVDRCLVQLGGETGERIHALLRGSGGNPEALAAELEHTELAQAAIFTVEVALIELLGSYGVRPDAVAGHSVGEVAAACASGALTLEDAARVVTARGRVMERAHGQGKMAQIALGAGRIEELLAGRQGLDIAAENAPNATVVAGSPEAVDALVHELKARGIATRELGVRYAFHSAQMESLRPELEAALAGVTPRRATVPMVSTVTGERIEGGALDAAYWGRNLRQRVRLSAAVARLLEDGVTELIEIGPHPLLSVALQQIAQERGKPARVVSTLRRERPEREAVLGAIAALYARGVSPDAKVLAGQGRLVDLPTYPWQRRRHWKPITARASEDAEGEVLVCWRTVAEASPSFLGDHRILGQAVLPFTFHLELALSCAWGISAAPVVELVGFEVQEPVPLSARPTRVRFAMGQVRDGSADFSVRARDEASDGRWRECARGALRIVNTAGAEPPRQDLAQVRGRCPEHLPGEAYFEAVRQKGIEYGPAFQGLKELWRGEREALGRVELPAAAGEAGEHLLHPALLDGCLQALAGALSRDMGGEVYLPIAVERVTVYGRVGREAWSHARATRVSTELVRGDVTLTDGQDRVLVELEGVALKRAEAAALGRAERQRQQELLYAIGWEAKGVKVTPPIEGTWILVGDGAGLGDALGRALAERGARAMRVQVEELEPTLMEQGAAVRAVVCLGDDARQPRDAADLSTALQRSLSTALHVVQAMSRTGARGLRLVTRGAQRVGSERPSALGQALWGLGRTIRVEQPDLDLQLIDIEPGAGANLEMGPLLDALGAHDGEDQVALRGGQRHVARLERYRGRGATGARVRPDRTYLVTGGLGGLGTAVARWLLAQGAGHVVLLGRSPLGDRDLLAELGPRAEYRPCDVREEGQVRAVLASLEAERPPLGGVVHAAGVLDDGLIANQTWERFERVLSPKAVGAFHLDRLTRGRGLELFVLFSSAASALGSPGQSSYSAANAYLDGLAQERQSDGEVALSIGWGPWSEVGMASRGDGRDQARRQASGLEPLSPSRGIALFAELTREAAPHILALPVSWERLAASLPPGTRPALLSRWLGDRPARAAPPSELVTRLAAEPPRRRRELLADLLRREVLQILGRPPGASLAADKPFNELGFDSLMAVELRNALVKLTGARISTTVLFDYPTLEALCEHVLTDVLALPVEGRPVPQAAELRHPSSEPIAIVGMSCRFPGGANDPDAFWELLRNGTDAIVEVPRERWDADALFDPDPDAPGKMVTRWGGFLQGVDISRFDAAFFGITPREARRMDPQQRLILEVAWEALEDAGLVPEELMGTQAGVFLGFMTNDYAKLGMASADVDVYQGTGNLFSFAPGRLSYLLGLQGPSVALDTACSSALVALHLACQALRNGECSVAFAGGVSLMLAPDATLVLSKLRAMAADGRCKTFDAAADGYVRGEGCGIVVLKRLSDAIEAGDDVLAVIRGSAINHDGRSSGLTAPNGPAQQAVIRSALAAASISPEQVGYVETHGTGTPLGDPIEVQALAAVMRQGREEGRPLLIGSVKTNVGHLEAAAGMAGLLKVVLALQRGVIPAHLHFRRPSPHIAWEELPVSVVTQPTAWTHAQGRRIAGLSSFGMSGTNAHVLVEEAPAPRKEAPAEEGDAIRVLPISARSPEALRATAERLARRLQGWAEEGTVRWVDVPYTAWVRRAHHPHRAAVVARSLGEAAERLRALARGERGPFAIGGPDVPVDRPRVAFIYSGQGSQWLGMGRDLYATEPVFRDAVERCLAHLSGETGERLGVLLRGAGPGDAEALAAELERTQLAQAAIFTVEVALTDLLAHCGVHPDAVAGHSVGEVAAGYAGGALTLGDAARVVMARGRVMERAHGQGKMAQIELRAGRVEALLAGRGGLDIAAENAPGATVVAGAVEAVDALVQELKAAGVAVRELGVRYAFHSAQMEPFRSELEGLLAGISPRAASIPMVSTVTGERIEGGALNAAYWGSNLRQRVRFAAAIGRLLEEGITELVEIGPHAVLGAAMQGCAEGLGKSARVVATLRRQRPEREAVLATVAALYAYGVPMDAKALAGEGRFVRLPTYPWQRRRYWVEDAAKEGARTPSRGAEPAGAQDARHPLLGKRLPVPFPSFQAHIRPTEPAYLADHRIGGRIVFPATGYLEMVASAASTLGAGPWAIESLQVEEPLLLEAEERTLHLAFTPDGRGQRRFSIHSAPVSGDTSSWRSHVVGSLGAAGGGAARPLEPAEVQGRCPEVIAPEAHYALFDQLGFELGPAFRGVTALWRGEREALGQVTLPEAAGDAAGSVLHPALLDGCLQVLAAAIPKDVEPSLYLPIAVDRLMIHKPAGRKVWSHARTEPVEQPRAELVRGSVTVADEQGEVLAQLDGLTLRRAGMAALEQAKRRRQELLYELGWEVKRPERTRPLDGTWVLVGDGDGLGEALGRALQERGARVLRAGEAPGDQRVEAAVGPDVRAVVLLAGVATASRDAAEPMEALRRSLGGALHLVNVMGRAGARRLYLVTRGAQRVGSERASAVGQALWGFGRTVLAEWPEIEPRLVDIEEGPSADSSANALVVALAADESEDQAAIRGGERYVARLKRYRTRSASEAPIRSDRSYLVSGGLGGLGLAVARWLVAKGAGHVLLLGRSPAQRNEALERLGDRVEYQQCDVSDGGQLRAALDAWEGARPSLGGVIHAAGVLDDGAIAHQTWERFERVLAPKVLGAFHLDKLTRGRGLDFFVLFSSASGTLGSPGQSAYAAANGYLDGLAHERQAAGEVALSIGWGAWSEVGMAARAGAQEANRRAAMGLGALSPEQGLALFEELLRERAAHVLALPMNWERLTASLPAERRPALLSGWLRDAPGSPERPEAVAQRRSFLAQLSGASLPRQRQLLTRHVRSLVEQVMSLGPGESLEANAKLFEAGMDSIMALDLRKRLEASLGVSIHATAIFNYPSITLLAEHLATVLGGPPRAAPEAPAESAPDEALTRLAELSEEEAERLLEQKLSSL